MSFFQFNFPLVTMKKPSLISKLKLEYALPFTDLGIDVDSQQCRDMGKQLKKFYFGYSALSVETIFVYLMVIYDLVFTANYSIIYLLFHIVALLIEYFYSS